MHFWRILKFCLNKYAEPCPYINWSSFIPNVIKFPRDINKMKKTFPGGGGRGQANRLEGDTHLKW